MKFSQTVGSIAIASCFLVSAKANAGILFTIPTHFGRVIVDKNDDADSVALHFKGKNIALDDESPPDGNAADFGVQLQGIYHLKDSDIIVLTEGTYRDGPDAHSMIRVSSRDIRKIHPIAAASANIGNNDQSDIDLDSDPDQLKIIQKGDEIFFDLGFDNGKVKTALYHQGVLQVTLSKSRKRKLNLSKSDCADVLNHVAACRSADSALHCDEAEDDSFDQAFNGTLNTIENRSPGYKNSVENACEETCKKKSFVVLEVRKKLCGY